MTRVRVDPAEIACGIPLPFDIVSADGDLLLSCGHVIQHEETRLNVIETGFRLHPGEIGAHEPAFLRMERLANRLAAMEDELLRGCAPAGWQAGVVHLAQELNGLCDREPDAAFAVMHLEIRHAYDVVHHAMAALICSRLAPAVNLSAVERTSLVAAALTHDIALLPVRRELESVDRLSADQMEMVRGHCRNGVRRLRELGVTDPLWLRTVAEHHEYLDGSGYEGLPAARLSVHSRVMALADALSAMLRPRPYRERLLAGMALVDLWADPQGRYDHALVELLVAQLGLYPPGSVLRLANRETAVVIRTPPDQPANPHAVAILDPAGRPLYRAARRDIAQEATAVTGLLSPEMVGKVRQQLFKYWTKN